MSKKQPRRFVEEVGDSDLERTEELHDSIVDWAEDHCPAILEEVFGIEIEYYTAERELPLKTKRDAIGGYVDLHVTAFQSDMWHPIQVCFEIKSSIKRSGYLFRQLQWYREIYRGEPSFVVVSPDSRHANRIIENEYKFFRFEDGFSPMYSGHPKRLKKSEFLRLSQKIEDEYFDYSMQRAFEK